MALVPVTLANTDHQMSKQAEIIALTERRSWQQQIQDAIRTPRDLAAALKLKESQLPFDRVANQSFEMLVPRHFVAKMQPGDPSDPLLRQVLAVSEENRAVPGYSADPVAEIQHYGGTPGVLQKYSGRALLVLTGQCAINCRYCFRRHYPYAENQPSSKARRASIAELLRDDTFQELILSGGDPLMLPDTQLAQIATQLAESATPRQRKLTLRIHSRLPIVIPDRINSSLCEALTPSKIGVVLVVHSNHPAEIDADTKAALQRLRNAGITVLNQSVLLAGINDDAKTLAALSDALFDAGALPYYLHALDKVAGAAHFDVTHERARTIVGELAEQRPGYLVPKLMVETPYAGSKRELAPLYSELTSASIE